jgi:DNA mismatch repair protein MutS2
LILAEPQRPTSWQEPERSRSARDRSHRGRLAKIAFPPGVLWRLEAAVDLRLPVTSLLMVPQPILHSSARLLEFDLLRDWLRGYATSPLGQRLIAELAPASDRVWIEHQQQLTIEISEFRRVGGSFDFSGLQDIRGEVEKSSIAGAALETAGIRNVLLVVDRAAEWREITLRPPQAMRSDWRSVAALSAQIADFTAWLRTFRNKILPDGTLDDRASPELARIRRDMDKQRRFIQDSLRTYLRRLTEDGAAQDELVTIRGERFVIPIKTEQKRRVQGVVHGASSSGQTVFVEPLETIEQNNELVRLLEEEQAEVQRILVEMTERIAEHAEAILEAFAVLSELEFQFAKARFAEDYHCVPVKFSADANLRLSLQKARHPLLERRLRLHGDAIIPITIELDRNHRELVITGPNTGGKTVALKTIGLLALMAQSGMLIPADRAELPIFDAVLADIGDYQSIEQNLSTFSAHVTNIDSIARTATAQSLVLLDELGSSTDPEEGAALAVAMAEYFRRIGAITVLSAHHTSLKVFAANTEGVRNAAVGFDEATLEPTYELKMGVPGASAGINIAQRLGLNPSIIEAARLRLGSQARDVGQLLSRLHAELREAEAERLRLDGLREELAREKAHVAAEGKRDQQAKVKEMERKLDTLLRDFEYHAREAVQAIQDRVAAQKLSRDAERRIAKLRREFRDAFDATVVAHSTGADQGDPHAQDRVVHASEGDTVKLKSVGRPARILRRLDDRHFEVEIGQMKMKIAGDDIAEVLARAKDSPVAAARARGISVTLEKDSQNVPAEINVIGRTVEDATREVERFVDRAFLAGLPRIRVVHGTGMGILRKALRQFLEKHPHVESIAEPPQNQGGGGATVVDLRI